MITDKQPSAEQAAIVSSDAPAIVVTAGAGSGKTEVLARRVERILADSPDESFRVLAVTYTVKAADEMEDRLRQLVTDVGRVDIETVHAFAHRLILQARDVGRPSRRPRCTRPRRRPGGVAGQLARRSRHHRGRIGGEKAAV